MSDMDIYPTWIEPVLPDTVATDYDYLYSDDPADNSAYTLAEFYGICYARRGRDYFTIGDKIKMVCSTNVFTDTEIVLRVIGFDHFRLADNNDEFASVVFDMIGVMNSSIRFKDTSGWQDEIRTYLNETIFSGLPTYLQKMIKEVAPRWYNPDSGNVENLPAKLILLTFAEIGKTTDATLLSELEDGETPPVFGVFTDNASRIKKTSNGTGDPASWFVRSRRTGSFTHYTHTVNENGGISAIGAPNLFDVHITFAFCI